jgi:hypothetical protein
MIVDESEITRFESAKDRRWIRNTMRFLALWPTQKARMIYRPRWYPYFGISHEAAAKIGKWPHD